MNAVYGSIIENLRSIEIVYEDTAAYFKKDRTNTSNSKEVSVKQFIESYLPHDFQVKSQSKIYSKDRETNNIDCIVLTPNHPKLITPIREIVIAEGVYAALEVKPDISTLTQKSELYRGLLQIKSVKNINRSVQRLPFWELLGEKKPSDYFDKIPAVIFSSKSSDLEKTVKFITKKVLEGELKYEELPDLIVCLDKGIISYSPVFQETSLAEFFRERGESYIPEKAFVTYKSSEKADILVLFLRYILNFNAPYTLDSSFILLDYLNIITTTFEIKLHELES